MNAIRERTLSNSPVYVRRPPEWPKPLVSYGRWWESLLSLHNGEVEEKSEGRQIPNWSHEKTQKKQGIFCKNPQSISSHFFSPRWDKGKVISVQVLVKRVGVCVCVSLKYPRGLLHSF